MKTIEFPAADSTLLHVEEGNVVARGEVGRTAGTLSLPDDVEPTITEVDGQTRLHLSRLLAISLPTGVTLQIEGRPRDVVLRNLSAAQVQQCSGDLVASDLETLHVSEAVSGDVALRKITHTAQVQVTRGDLAASHIANLQAPEVRGSVSISEVQRLHLGQIGGDLAVTGAGEADIQRVGGDASFSSVRDRLSLLKVGGDLAVNSPGQTVTAGQVAGDAALRGPLAAGGMYGITASGTVALRVSGGARLTVACRGDVISGADIALTQDAQGRFQGRIEGAEPLAELTIDAGGDVLINSSSRGQRRQHAHVEKEIKQAMQEVKRELRRTAATISEEARRARRSVEVELNGADVRENLGASVRDMVRDLLDSLDPQARSAPRPTPPRPAPPAARPASSPTRPAPPQQEVSMILDMLANGAITAEEAAALIDALRN